LNISYDRFIRTTDEDHKKIVVEFIKKCDQAGDIYKGDYKGLYCTGCETYYTKKDCPEGICPLHARPLEEISEETYFFRLSKYQNFLLDLYETDFTQPKIRSNEVRSRVEEGLNDLSISRTSFNWGIPFPLDEKHITYVWFDALINYYTATRQKGKESFWGKPTVHILGKDNTWFHNVYWPAMLKSAGIDLPKNTINHGFLTFNGQKISKSLGNAISPKTLVEKYGSDTVRYFCLRHFSFASGNDGDFDEGALIERHNNELANKLGNLVSRTSSLAEKYGIKKFKDQDFETTDLLNSLNKKILELMETFQVDKALNEIFGFIDQCNEYIQNKKPWENNDREDRREINKGVLYTLVKSIKEIARFLSPFIPETAEKILEIFKSDKIKKAPVLFEKIGLDEQKTNKEEIQNKDMENVTNIKFEDFAKVELKVAQIKKVEEIEGADKLYKLTLDDGAGERIICAGIKQFYKIEELKNKKIIIVANLAPRKLRGIESRGMLLAASNRDHTQVSLITPDSEIEVGSLVG
jgi:methionyl-tRNA synthetase